jgi:hypothetical protein
MVEGYVTSWKVAGSSPDGVTELFSLYQVSQLHHSPVVDSVSNRNEYENIFLGVKLGRSTNLTT